MATHEERIQALEDLVPGIARSQEMIVDALGAISEAMRGIVRTQQEHRGIPIFAADVIVTTEGERVVKIHGHPAPDIDLATTTPANDYSATLTLAEASLEHAVAPEDDGTLVIMPVNGGGYRLAWLGVVVIDRGLERVALDAETGNVLYRVPVVRSVSTGET